MEDITSEISINIISGKMLEIIFSGTKSDISISPPLLYDNSSNIIGVSVKSGLLYEIYYTIQNYYGNVTVLIPAFSIFTDLNKTNFNDITFMFNKSLPFIFYNFPSVIPEINFKTGITISIRFVNFPTGKIPLSIITNTNIESVSLSNNLYYHNGDIYFVSPVLYGEYNEEIQFKPIPNINSLGDSVTISIDNTSNVIQNYSNDFVYTITNNYNSITIENMIYDSINMIWNYNNECLIVSNIQYNIFTLSTKGDDCDPTFELRNYTGLFEIDTNGVITKLNGVIDGNYDLDIVIRTRFGEELFIILKIVIVDIFSDLYLPSLSSDKYTIHGLSVYIEFFNRNEETTTFVLGISKISLLKDLVYIFTQTIEFILQQSMDPDFKMNNDDVLRLGEALLTPSESLFKTLLESKFENIIIDGILEKKINYFVNKSFNFYKNILTKYINTSVNNEIFKMSSDTLKYFIEIKQK